MSRNREQLPLRATVRLLGVSHQTMMLPMTEPYPPGKM
jgi:hypothetical protein